MTASPPTVERRGRLAGDTGAMLVEAALVLPMVLWLVMALIDFSLVELRQSQLTSAARDGARAGIITWVGADQLGTYDLTANNGTCPSPGESGSFANICNAVLQRLVGSTADTITVGCYEGQTNVKRSSCSTATVTPGMDTMVVTVAYTYQPLTFVGQSFMGSSTSFTSSARMVIQ